MIIGLQTVPLNSFFGTGVLCDNMHLEYLSVESVKTN